MLYSELKDQKKPENRAPLCISSRLNQDDRKRLGFKSHLIEGPEFLQVALGFINFAPKTLS